MGEPPRTVIKLATNRHEVAMNTRPMLAAFFLLVPVTAACAGSDTPAKPTVVSTYCTSKSLRPDNFDRLSPSTQARLDKYENTTYAVWSDGSQTELRSELKANMPCQK